MIAFEGYAPSGDFGAAVTNARIVRDALFDYYSDDPEGGVIK